MEINNTLEFEESQRLVLGAGWIVIILLQIHTNLFHYLTCALLGVNYLMSHYCSHAMIGINNKACTLGLVTLIHQK